MLYYDTARFFDDDIRRGFCIVREVEQSDIRVRYDKEFAPAVDNIAPAIADKHDRSRVEYARLKFVPDERDLGHRSHTAAKRDEADGPRDEVLQAFVEMIGRDLVGEIPVGFGLELVHDNSEHASARFPCTARRGFHHTEITAGAYREPGFRETFSDLSRVSILIRIGATLRSAKNRYDPVFRISDHLFFRSSVGDIIAKSYGFRFLGREVSRFMDRLRCIRHEKDQTADDEEDDESENRLTKRTGRTDDDRKHQLSHPRRTLL